jgi:hypothetical protein
MILNQDNGYDVVMTRNLVLVHLGKNPSPILIEMAEVATKRLDDSKIFLITDHPSDWVKFPGKVISYSRKDRKKYLASLIRKNPELEQIAGGYWLYSLERLFALEKIYDYVDSDEAVLHFESDVLLLLNDSDFELMLLNSSQCACPRFSKDRGIASLFFVPNNSELLSLLKSMKEILSRKNAPTNDMELLGICLNEDIVDELPSLPNSSWEKPSGEKLVFDGAAYGQYLFGQDPFHTGGRRISGFQNPDFPVELSQLNWKVSEAEDLESKSIVYTYNFNEYRVLNLHLHSKIRTGDIDNRSPLWVKAINEANGKTSRIPGEIETNLIHTQKITILNRLRIARRKGLAKSLGKYVMRSVNRANQSIWRNDD